MGFGEAISAGFSNYVNFSDRASRSEYWYWILFIILAEIVTSIIDYAIGAQVVTGIFGLATFLPSLGLAIRRLHDLDRTGWWVLLWFIPIIGWIILLIWFCTRGTIGPNRFGPDPLSALNVGLNRPAGAIR
jgi:uncharacterized membrane protein YhaH (DUF805 family)